MLLDIKKAIENWDFFVLKEIFYNRDKDSVKRLQELCHEVFKAKKASSLLKFNLSFLELSSSRFESFKSSFFCKDSTNFFFQKNWKSNLLFKKNDKHTGYIFDISFISKNKIDLFKDYLYEFQQENDKPIYIEMDYLSFQEHFYMYNDWEGFFLDYIPSNEAICKEFFLEKALYPFVENVRKYLRNYPEKKIYINFILDFPGQSFEDIINDLKIYSELEIAGFQIYPFQGQKNTVWEIFEAACFTNYLKLVMVLMLHKKDCELFIQKNYLNNFQFIKAYEEVVQLNLSSIITLFNDF